MIVCVPMMDWHYMTQRPQQLMKQLAKLGYTVYYCNATQRDREMERLGEGLYLVHHYARWTREVLPGLRKGGEESLTAWCGHPGAVRYLKACQPDRVIYDCADDFAEWLPLEKEMAARADLILSSSAGLFNRLGAMYPHKHVVLIRNGYDDAMTGIDADASVGLSAGGTRLGYIGAWAPWVDERLLLRAAAAFDADVWVVGAEFQRRFQPLHPRVHFAGRQPHGLLPRYLASFHVCLIPFRINPLTLAVNPVKAYEYLGAGKPVVSTALPECRRMIPHVDVAETDTDFLELIGLRLQDPGSAETRRAYAMANTWHRRALELAPYLAALG